MTGWGDEPNIESAVYEALTASQDVVAIVGSRVFHAKLSDGAALPAISYFLVDRVKVTTHDGPTERAESFVEVDVWAKEKADVARLAGIVDRLLSTVTGTFGGLDIFGTIQVRDQTRFDSALGARRRILEYRLFHSQPRVVAMS